MSDFNLEGYKEIINSNCKELELIMKALLNKEKLNLRDKSTLNKNLEKQEKILNRLDELGI